MRGDKQFPGLGQAVLLVLAVFCIQVAMSVSLMVSVFMLNAAGVPLKRALFQEPLFLGITNLMAFGGPLVFGIWWQKASPGQVLPLGRLPGPLLLCSIIATVIGEVVVASEIDNLTRMLLPPPEWIARVFQGILGVEDTPLQSAFLLVLVAPVTEELFFRGLILRGLLARHSKTVAVVVTALLFAALHISPWQLFSATMLGIVFGWWFVRTRGLIPCLIGHALVNGTVFSSSCLPFKIPGFNIDLTQYGPARFQPIWFDVLGLTLFLLGLWSFHKLTSQPAGRGKTIETCLSDS